MFDDFDLDIQKTGTVEHSVSFPSFLSICPSECISCPPHPPATHTCGTMTCSNAFDSHCVCDSIRVCR